jgi:sulfur carrier protein ThiS
VGAVSRNGRASFHIILLPFSRSSGTRVLFINNDGGGFADRIDIDAGITVDKLFEQRLPGRQPEDFLIRVNYQPVSADQVLQEGDRISISPTKIDGAVA